MSRPDVIKLLSDLLAAKSYSSEEGPAADVLEQFFQAAGADVRRLENNIIATKGTGEAALLFNSHLDTVPATDRWTRDPWKPELIEGQLYGLGATDAKSCVAAMAAAFVEAPDPGDAGRIVLTATVEEETGGFGHPNGMELTLPKLGKISGAVVGEPTQLNICNGQRGMARVILHAEGRAGHASRPWQGENAIHKAAIDIIAIKALEEELRVSGQDPVLGVPTVQPTIISGGSAKNVIPDHTEIVLDIRTTRRCDNQGLITRLSGTVKSRMEVVSSRFLPIATEPDTPLILAAQAVLPEADIRAFGGCSDMFFLTQVPGDPVACCLIGPGNGAQSHQPDEFVDVEMVRKGVDAYLGIMTRYWEFQRGHQ
jgi:acetylornithine deacetylase